MSNPKKLKEIDPWLGAITTLGFLAGMRTDELQDSRANALTVEENGYCVDTCLAVDTGTWETGIEVKDNPWVIVEQYHNKKDAEIGHAKWVELMRKDPDMKLEDIDIWGLESS